MDEIEQLSALPSFPGGSLESKMCSKISELTQVILIKLLKFYGNFRAFEKTVKRFLSICIFAAHSQSAVAWPWHFFQVIETSETAKIKKKSSI